MDHKKFLIEEELDRNNVSINRTQNRAILFKMLSLLPETMTMTQ